MPKPSPSSRTSKGEATRDRILDAAVRLFRANGYEAATLRQIAKEAGVSPGLAYRYFDSKDGLVLALYARLTGTFRERIEQLPPGPWSDRAMAAMRASLDVLGPHRDTLGVLLGAMFHRRGDGIYVPWAANQAAVRDEFVRAVEQSENAPAGAVELGEALYLAHLGVLLFWLLDRSEAQQATDRLVAWAEGLVPWAGMVLTAPFVQQPARALVQIIRDGIYGAGPGGEE